LHGFYHTTHTRLLRLHHTRTHTHHGSVHTHLGSHTYRFSHCRHHTLFSSHTQDYHHYGLRTHSYCGLHYGLPLHTRLHTHTRFTHIRTIYGYGYRVPRCGYGWSHAYIYTRTVAAPPHIYHTCHALPHTHARYLRLRYVTTHAHTYVHIRARLVQFRYTRLVTHGYADVHYCTHHRYVHHYVTRTCRFTAVTHGPRLGSRHTARYTHTHTTCTHGCCYTFTVTLHRTHTGYALRLVTAPFTHTHTRTHTFTRYTTYTAHTRLPHHTRRLRAHHYIACPAPHVTLRTGLPAAFWFAFTHGTVYHSTRLRLRTLPLQRMDVTGCVHTVLPFTLLRLPVALLQFTHTPVPTPRFARLTRYTYTLFPLPTVTWLHMPAFTCYPRLRHTDYSLRTHTVLRLIAGSALLPAVTAGSVHGSGCATHVLVGVHTTVGFTHGSPHLHTHAPVYAHHRLLHCTRTRARARFAFTAGYLLTLAVYPPYTTPLLHTRAPTVTYTHCHHARLPTTPSAVRVPCTVTGSVTGSLHCLPTHTARTFTAPRAHLRTLLPAHTHCHHTLHTRSCRARYTHATPGYAFSLWFLPQVNVLLRLPAVYRTPLHTAHYGYGLVGFYRITLHTTALGSVLTHAGYQRARLPYALLPGPGYRWACAQFPFTHYRTLPTLHGLRLRCRGVCVACGLLLRAAPTRGMHTAHTAFCLRLRYRVVTHAHTLWLHTTFLPCTFTLRLPVTRYTRFTHTHTLLHRALRTAFTIPGCATYVRCDCHTVTDWLHRLPHALHATHRLPLLPHAPRCHGLRWFGPPLVDCWTRCRATGWIATHCAAAHAHLLPHGWTTHVTHIPRLRTLRGYPGSGYVSHTTRAATLVYSSWVGFTTTRFPYHTVARPHAVLPRDIARLLHATPHVTHTHGLRTRCTPSRTRTRLHAYTVTCCLPCLGSADYARYRCHHGSHHHLPACHTVLPHRRGFTALPRTLPHHCLPPFAATLVRLPDATVLATAALPHVVLPCCAPLPAHTRFLHFSFRYRALPLLTRCTCGYGFTAGYAPPAPPHAPAAARALRLHAHAYYTAHAHAPARSTAARIHCLLHRSLRCALLYTRTVRYPALPFLLVPGFARFCTRAAPRTHYHAVHARSHAPPPTLVTAAYLTWFTDYTLPVTFVHHTTTRGLRLPQRAVAHGFRVIYLIPHTRFTCLHTPSCLFLYHLVTVTVPPHRG